MNLIEVYIQEVTRRLPEKGRKDIELELRSTIEDMLPDDHCEEDVKKVLDQLGNPASLASGYRDQPMHLIGPRYFDLYMSLLKMILPLASIVGLISMIASYVVDYSGEEAVLNVVLTILGHGIWTIMETGIQVFFWLTLVFAILERRDKGKEQEPLSANLKKWTPDDLKSITYIPKKKAISKFEVYGTFIWTAIWASLYFYASYLIGIYKGGEDGLDFVTPALNQEVLFSYWPLVIVVIVLDIALGLYQFIKGQWTTKMAVLNTIIELFAVVVILVIVISPNLWNQEFLTYMSELLSMTTKRFETWLISGVIVIKVIYVITSIWDGFRKARAQ